MPAAPTSQEISVRTAELFALYRKSREEQGIWSDRSLALRNEIAKVNARLVYKVAHRFHQNSREPYKDLEQVAQIGLIKAIEGFELSKGLAFSSFAIPKMRGEILHYLRDKTTPIKVPRRWQELYSRGQTVKRNLSLQTGRFPTEAEVAIALEVDLVDWQRCQKAHSANLVGNIDDCNIDDHQSETYTLEIEADFSWEVEIRQLQSALARIGTENSTAILAAFASGPVKTKAVKGGSPARLSEVVRQGLEDLIVAIAG